MFEDDCETTQNGIWIVINSPIGFVCNYIKEKYKVYDKPVALIGHGTESELGLSGQVGEALQFSLKRTHSSKLEQSRAAEAVQQK